MPTFNLIGETKIMSGMFLAFFEKFLYGGEAKVPNKRDPRLFQCLSIHISILHFHAYDRIHKRWILSLSLSLSLSLFVYVCLDLNLSISLVIFCKRKNKFYFFKFGGRQIYYKYTAFRIHKLMVLDPFPC